MPDRFRLRRPGGLWRHRDFMRLWGAQTISQFGSEVTALALPLVAILTLEVSAFEVALLSTLAWLPWLLFSLPVGAWVDRVRRRPVLIGADLGRALVLATVPVAYALDAVTIWQLYAVGFLVGVLTVFFDVAYQSYLPSLVRREELPEGNSKLEISRSGASFAGPALAGALLEVVKAPVAILVDAASFVLSGAWLTRIEAEEKLEAVEERGSIRSEIGAGLRFVIGNRYLRPSMVYVGVFNFFAEILGAVFLVYAVRELELSAGTIGLIFGLSNIGFLTGAVLAPRISRRLGVGPTLICSAALGGFTLFLVPLAPQSNPVPFLLAQGILIGFMIVLYNVAGISFFQAITPDRMLGRMNASRRFVVWGIIPLGSLAGGVLASTIGLRETLFVGASGASVAFLPLLFSPLRSLREIPAAEPALEHA